MKLIPTRAELKQRWLNRPWAWFKFTLVAIKAHPSLASGAIVGLIVPILGLLYLHLGSGESIFLYGHGHSGGQDIFLQGHSSGPDNWHIFINHMERLLCIPFALTMFLYWISHDFMWGNYYIVALFLFSMGSGSLLFWVVACLGRCIHNYGRIGFLCACGAVILIFAAYLHTWSFGTAAVRNQITQDCMRQQKWGHDNYPKQVPATPIKPDIFYCFPIAPGIIATEHCFLYGPLMGGGSQDLWLWDGSQACEVSGYEMWSH